MFIVIRICYTLLYIAYSMMRMYTYEDGFKLQVALSLVCMQSESTGQALRRNLFKLKSTETTLPFPVQTCNKLTRLSYSAEELSKDGIKIEQAEITQITK